MSSLATKCRIRQVPRKSNKYSITVENENAVLAESPDNVRNYQNGNVVIQQRTKNNSTDGEMTSHVENTHLHTSSLAVAVLSEMRVQTDRQAMLAERTSVLLEWRRVARAIDRISFWMILLVLLIQSIITLIIYPNAGQE
jgi:hypothetical protein